MPTFDPGLWVAALLTLAVLSSLVRDNPVYRMAQYLFVGVSAGYFVVLAWWTVIDPQLVRPLWESCSGAHHAGLGTALGLFVSTALAVLWLSRLSPRTAWLSRWPLALVVGVYVGIRVMGVTQSDMVMQVEASLRSFRGSLGTVLDALLATLGLVTVLLTFTFTRERRGAMAWSARIGSAFLMVALGAGFGAVVMSRVSVLIGRIQFLLGDWLHLR